MLVSAGAGALLLAAWRAAAVERTSAPLLALIDIDTPGARGAYGKFQAAIERRFADARVMPETRFVTSVLPADAESTRRLGESLKVLRPQIIIGANPLFAKAARTLNLGAPILFFSADDPLADELTDSLIRPSSGMTGFTLGASSSLKRQEMLLRLVPRCRVMGQIVSSEFIDEGLQRPSAFLANPWKQVEHRRFTCGTPLELAAISIRR
jgi:hypothetical protein